MKVTVRYFASLRETLGKEAEELELPAGVATVGALRAHLRSRGGAYGEALAEKRLVRAALNQDMVGAATSVKGGDEVAFFPPVTGG
ncbi:MAG: molybdopterin converting factor subunit 1 [Clostridia bacterium]